MQTATPEQREWLPQVVDVERIENNSLQNVSDSQPKTNSEEPSFLRYYDSLARKNSTGERIEG